MTANADEIPIAARLAETSVLAPAQQRTPAAGNSLASSELHIEIHSEAAALTRLGPDWNELFDRAGRPAQVFQTHAYAQLFVKTNNLGGPASSGNHNCRCKLAILTIRRNGRLVLVFPLVQSRQLGNTVVSWLGEPITQYGDVLIDPDEDARTLVTGALQHIATTLGADIFRLRKIRSDAAIAPVLAELGILPLDVVEAPCVTLAAGGSAFEDRQNGKAKKNRRRLMRRLEERGAVTFQELDSRADVQAVVRAGLEQKRDWLVRRGLVSPSLADTHVDAFMTAAAADSARVAGCALFALSLNDRPIAVALGFRCKSRLMLHFISYAADVEKNGAGILNLEAILRLAEADGLEAVDLLPPKADYKLDWSDHTVVVADYTWGATARGKLFGALLDKTVKPSVKRAIECLPLAMRQRLAAQTLKAARGTSRHQNRTPDA